MKKNMFLTSQNRTSLLLLHLVQVMARRYDEIKQQSKAVDEEIQSMVVKVINALLQSERQLVEEYDAVACCW